MPDKPCVYLLDGPGPQYGAHKGKDNAVEALVQIYRAPADKVCGRGQGAATALEFIGAKGYLGGDSQGQKNGQGNQPAATGNGIHKSGNKAGQEKKQKTEHGKIKIQCKTPKFWGPVRTIVSDSCGDRMSSFRWGQDQNKTYLSGHPADAWKPLFITHNCPKKSS